jgi:arginyl-tRNA synthetase
VNLNQTLQNLLRDTLAGLNFPVILPSLEIPPDSKLGDRSSTVALSLARNLKRNPREIAEEILAALPKDEAFLERIDIAGPGYLNFFFSQHAFTDLLQWVLEAGSDYGQSELGSGEKRLFEFVSANPTGPMNVVSARAAAVGDSLVKLQRKIGFDADAEYYVNDAGRQIEHLGESVKARLLETEGKPLDIPEGGYHGAYIIDLAKEAIKQFGAEVYTKSDLELGGWSADLIVEDQRKTLEKYGILFDRWFRESDLRDQDAHVSALEKLEKSGRTYEKDGAKFFRSTDFGDDEDRVVVTSDGRSTYFLPDIAYHLNKAERGYKKAVDLLGPDHHGHGKRMQAAMLSVDLPEDFLEILIVQQVNLLRRGKPVKMSKRTGEIITLKELIEEVGPDAAKQIFLSRRWSSHLDFDIEAAKDRSEKSPVFYLQYAHARISSIFRKAGELGQMQRDDLERLTSAEERELIRCLSLFPDVIEGAALQYAPHRLNSYLNELSTVFTRFYHACRVLGDDDSLTRARLALCRAVQIVLKEGLRLLGMSAPESM